MRWFSCLLMLLASTGCTGRRVATTFIGMESHVPAGAALYVTTSDGQHVKGRLTTVSASSMQMSLADQSSREFREADVARIRTKDALWNGIVIGATTGGSLTFALNDGSCLCLYRQPARGGNPPIRLAVLTKHEPEKRPSPRGYDLQIVAEAGASAWLR